MKSNESRLTQLQWMFVVAILAIVFLGLEATPLITATSPTSWGRLLGAVAFKGVVFLALSAVVIRLWWLGRIENRSAFPPVVLFAIGLYCVQSYFIFQMLYRASSKL